MNNKQILDNKTEILLKKYIKKCKQHNKDYKCNFMKKVKQFISFFIKLSLKPTKDDAKWIKNGMNQLKNDTCCDKDSDSDDDSTYDILKDSDNDNTPNKRKKNIQKRYKSSKNDEEKDESSIDDDESDFDNAVIGMNQYHKRGFEEVSLAQDLVALGINTILPFAKHVHQFLAKELSLTALEFEYYWSELKKVLILSKKKLKYQPINIKTQSQGILFVKMIHLYPKTI